VAERAAPALLTVASRRALNVFPGATLETSAAKPAVSAALAPMSPARKRDTRRSA
jgi:hypothetical protein